MVGEGDIGGVKGVRELDVETMVRPEVRAIKSGFEVFFSSFSTLSPKLIHRVMVMFPININA